MYKPLPVPVDYKSLKSSILEYFKEQDYWVSAFSVIAHLGMTGRPFPVLRCMKELYRAGVIESDKDIPPENSVQVYGVFYRIKAHE